MVSKKSFTLLVETETTDFHCFLDNICTALYSCRTTTHSKHLPPTVEYYKPTLVSGKIGKFKNIKLKFHIDNSVPSVAQPVLRIPFALREKIQTEIDKLEKLDIIGDITNHLHHG